MIHSIPFEFIKVIINWVMNNQGFLSLLFVVVGGVFALCQWQKNLVYKRAEIMQSLIETTRKDNTISTIMDIIDWNEDFSYDGKFNVNPNSKRELLHNISGEDLFKMVDYTLSVFSYICYLKTVKTLKKKDMQFFEYEIHRLVDNPHIANYLYSLYHWSKKLGVKMSFSFFIEYCMKMKYLDSSFRVFNDGNDYYKCFLIF